MRTTLSLDDDVAALLRKLQDKRRGTFKELVNEALRRGLAELGKPEKRRRRFRTREVALGRCLAGRLDDIAEVLAVGEGDAYR